MTGAKVAVTARAAVIESWHVPVPEQPSPDHPENSEPAGAVAGSVTVAPGSNRVAQTAPQSMPAGLDVTVPEPVPAFVTVSSGLSANVAVRERDALIVTTHVGVTPHPSPCHPANDDVGSGAA